MNHSYERDCIRFAQLTRAAHLRVKPSKARARRDVVPDVHVPWHVFWPAVAMLCGMVLMACFVPYLINYKG